MQIDGRRPFDVVFLVNRHVVAISLEECFGGAFDLNPRVARDDVVFAEPGLVYHETELVFAFAAVYRYFNEQVMVAVAYKGDFDIVFVEFLRNFVFVVDAILEESTALDFPTVVDAAASGEACGTYEDSGENRCEECLATCQKTKTHIRKIEKKKTPE